MPDIESHARPTRRKHDFAILKNAPDKNGTFYFYVSTCYTGDEKLSLMAFKWFAMTIGKGLNVKKIIVSGLINIETTVSIKDFPIEYQPIDYNFFGVDTTISGVGINVAAALSALGSNPVLLSITAKDLYQEIIESSLNAQGINHHLLPLLHSTPQAVILYDSTGRRFINLDLKNIQAVSYPLNPAENLLPDTSLAIMGNINFSRELMRFYKKNQIKIATDVHVVNDIEDAFNKEFMENADILFLSNENIIGEEQGFMAKLIAAYHNEIIVIGLGDQGVLMYVRQENSVTRYPAMKTRPIINTVGAGDALFSCFVHYYHKYQNPSDAMEKAIYFASYKIGEAGAASGFLDENELEKQFAKAKERL